jgi:hypothetical protein
MTNEKYVKGVKCQFLKNGASYAGNLFAWEAEQALDNPCVD